MKVIFIRSRAQSAKNDNNFRFVEKKRINHYHHNLIAKLWRVGGLARLFVCALAFPQRGLMESRGFFVLNNHTHTKKVQVSKSSLLY